eukprot:514892-Amphidinium_carterae.1
MLDILSKLLKLARETHGQGAWVEIDGVRFRTAEGAFQAASLAALLSCSNASSLARSYSIHAVNKPSGFSELVRVQHVECVVNTKLLHVPICEAMKFWPKAKQFSELAGGVNVRD